MAIAELTFSIGTTFKSGSKQAVLYDTLKNRGRDEEFQKIFGEANAYSFYAQAVGSIAARFLFSINVNLPMIISMRVMDITIIICILFDEPEIDITKTANESYARQITESAKYIVNHKKVLGVILFSVVFHYIYRVGFIFFKPYMVAVKILVFYFGVIFFLFNIVAAQASKRTADFVRLTKPRTLMVLSSLIFISVIALGMTKLWFGVGFIFLQKATRGLLNPVT